MKKFYGEGADLRARFCLPSLLCLHASASQELWAQCVLGPLVPSNMMGVLGSCGDIFGFYPHSTFFEKQVKHRLELVVILDFPV